MSYHKTRSEQKRDPNQPTASAMVAGRIAQPHAEVEGQPILGGLENTLVEGQGRSEEEEKEKIQEYHRKREETKQEHKKIFDDKTGKPKVSNVDYKPDPAGDSDAAPPTSPPERKTSPEEIKKMTEGEKKHNQGPEEKK